MRFRSFAADDIFISYTRLDASTYAAGLADELTRKGFSCFIDKLGTDPDKDLPDMLRRKVQSCAMLVIVGTERAGSRQTIEEEVREFLLTGRRTSIVPIDFGGAVYKARWYGLVEGIAPEPEKNVEALDDGEVSPSVVSRIEKQFNYTRRNQRLRRVTIGTAALLLVLIGASVAAGFYANRQIAAARGASSRADLARAEAGVAKGEADSAKLEAAKQRQEASDAKTLADQQKKLADKATLEAEAKTRLADAATRRATAADKEARRAKAEADQQKTIADSRSLANRSETLLRQQPETVPQSVRDAVRALKTARTVEADTALRDSVALLPLLRRSSVEYKGEISASALSPDGRHFATVSKNKLRIYQTDPSPSGPTGMQSGGLSPTPTKELAFEELPCECTAVALSSDLVSAAVLTPAGIETIDLHTGNRHVLAIVEEPVPLISAAREEAEGPGTLEHVALSPAGRYIALVTTVKGDPQTVSWVQVIDATNGRVVATPVAGGDLGLQVNDVAFGSTGNLAVGGSELGANGKQVGHAIIWPLAVSLWQQEASVKLTAATFSRPINVYRDGVIKAVAPGADESYLATDSAVLKLDARREYEPIARIPLPAGHQDSFTLKWEYALEDLAFNAAGDRLKIVRQLPSPIDDEVTAYEGSNKGLEEWDATGHWEVARLPLGDAANVASGQGSYLTPLAFGSDPSAELHQFLAADGSEVAAVRVRSLQTELVKAVPFFTISQDSAEVQGGRARRIQVPSNPDFPNVVAQAITPDGKFLVTAGEKVSLYTLEGESYRLLKLIAVAEPMREVGLTPDGQMLVTQTAEAGVVRVYRTRDGQEITLNGLSELGATTSWRLSPAGHFLAACMSNAVYVWQMSDGARVGSIANPYKIAVSLFFSPGERFLLTANEADSTSVLDLSTGKVRSLPLRASVSAAAFSEDDRFVALGAEDGYVMVYPTEALENEVARLPHFGRVTGVAFSGDGRRLVSVSVRGTFNKVKEDDTPLRVWLLQPEDLVAEAEKRLAALPAYAR